MIVFVTEHPEGFWTQANKNALRASVSFIAQLVPSEDVKIDVSKGDRGVITAAIGVATAQRARELKTRLLPLPKLPIAAFDLLVAEEPEVCLPGECKARPPPIELPPDDFAPQADGGVDPVEGSVNPAVAVIVLVLVFFFLVFATYRKRILAWCCKPRRTARPMMGNFEMDRYYAGRTY